MSEGRVTGASRRVMAADGLFISVSGQVHLYVRRLCACGMDSLPRITSAGDGLFHLLRDPLHVWRLSAAFHLFYYSVTTRATHEPMNADAKEENIIFHQLCFRR